MKKQILTLTATLALGAMVGCGGPKADQIGVESDIHRSTVTNQSQILGTPSNGQLFGSTIITLPGGSDLDGFEYNLEDPRKVGQWNAVLGRLPDGKGANHSYVYTREMATKVKDIRVSYLISSIGRLKDLSYKKLRPAKVGLEQITPVKKAVIPKLLKAIPCFNLKEDRKKCKTAADETTKTKPKRIRSCKQLASLKDAYVDLDEAGQAQLVANITQCMTIQGKFDALNDGVDMVTSLRDAGKEIVVDIVEKYSEHANFIGLVEANSKELDGGDIKSTIVFNKEMTKVEKFVLGLKFGNGTFEEYSLKNKKISDFEFGLTADNNRYLAFTINGEHTIRARLGVQSNSVTLLDGSTYFDIRMKGKTINTYKDGKVRNGIMYLQAETIDYKLQ